MTRLFLMIGAIAMVTPAGDISGLKYRYIVGLALAIPLRGLGYNPKK